MQACASWQVVAQPQSLAYLLPPFDNPGIVHTQLTTEVRAVQSKLTGNLRNVIFNVVQTIAGFDGFLILGTGSGLLPAKLWQLDARGFLLVTSNVVPCQQ